MEITKKIFGISLLPLILLAVGAFISGIIVYTSQSATKYYVAEYVERQGKVSEIYQLIGYGGGIHAFKNYILRGEDKYRISAVGAMTKAVALIEEYRSMAKLSKEEVAGMLTLEETISKYISMIEIAKKMIAQNRTQAEIDRVVKVDDTPAVKALDGLQSYFMQKSKTELLKLENSQKRALSTIVAIFLFALIFSLLTSQAIAKKIIQSIKSLLQISNEISEGNFLIDKEKVTHFSEDELKTLAHQMVKMADNLNSTFEQLKRSNEELTNFAFVASHDLQEPVKKISTYVELIEMKASDKLSGQVRVYMNEVKSSAHRMIKLIKALLNYSQLNSSKMKPEVVVLDDVIRACESNLEISIKESQAQILASNLPEVLGHKELLLSLFQNLISNAIKFGKKETPPKIKISAKHSQEGTWHILVEDNGIGFDIKYLDTILRPFGRIHSKSEYPGLGIGLALCKKIIEIHKSKLHIMSKENEGSQFSFSLKDASAF